MTLYIGLRPTWRHVLRVPVSIWQLRRSGLSWRASWRYAFVVCTWHDRSFVVKSI